MWNKHSGHRSKIGVIAGNVLFMAVEMIPALSWDNPIVMGAMSLITMFTGFAFRAAIQKGETK